MTELPTLRGERVTLRPLGGADAEALVEVVRSPCVRRWWGTEPDEPDAVLADHLRNEGRAFAIEAGGELAGWLGFEEELEPDFRHAGMDICLAAAHQGAGLGPEALRLAARWLVGERGHHRLTIDPARDNERAIRAYERVGFRPVGVMRRYARGHDGEWHDGLLMDLLAEELR